MILPHVLTFLWSKGSVISLKYVVTEKQKAFVPKQSNSSVGRSSGFSVTLRRYSTKLRGLWVTCSTCVLTDSCFALIAVVQCATGPDVPLKKSLKPAVKDSEPPQHAAPCPNISLAPQGLNSWHCKSPVRKESKYRAPQEQRYRDRGPSCMFTKKQSWD